jgi:acyl carrier protein
MTIRDSVFEVVLSVARQRNPGTTGIRPEQSLSADLGFESLDLAQVVAELEVRLGLDPFARHAASRVRTAGDLAALYEEAGSPKG